MKQNYFIIVLIFVIFSVISFLTNIINPLIPDVKSGFNLSNALAGMLPFSFFIAYGVMSIPAGILLERTGAKPMLVIPFLMAFLAALGFSLFQTFPVYLVSLFTIGLGMAMLQVTINPLLRSAGGESHFAAYSVLAQLFFGGAGYLGPQLYSYLVGELGNDKELTGITGLLDSITSDAFPWMSLYWVFALVTLLMAALILFSKLPKVELKEDERAGTVTTYWGLMKNKTVILFFFGIFAYVGTEQGVGNWISQFLNVYHDVDPQTMGADTVSRFWAMLTIGCMLGLVLLKLFDCRKVLVVFSSCAIISLTLGLFGSKEVSLIAFPMVGFFASVMWSVIFSLALNSVAEHHGSFSGVLCTGIMGGAIVPFLVGSLADLVGLRLGMMLLYVTLGYILSIGLWAKPLINNSTVSLKDLFQSIGKKKAEQR